VRKWALLGAAIAVEVAATLSLRASQDHSAWLVVVVAGYVGSFILLTMVLRTGTHTVILDATTARQASKRIPRGF